MVKKGTAWVWEKTEKGEMIQHDLRGEETVQVSQVKVKSLSNSGLKKVIAWVC